MLRGESHFDRGTQQAVSLRRGPCLVENLNRVPDLYIDSPFTQPWFHPLHTTRIPCRDHGCATSLNEIDLSLQQLSCHLRLRKIVNSRAAATSIRFGNFNEFQARNSF